MDLRKISFFRRTGLVALLAGVVLSTLPAVADTTDWSLSAGGFYTSAGGHGSTLSGSNIPTLSVTGDGTPAKNGASLSIIDGFSSFTSGAYNGNGSNWSWGGGVMNLMGCIPGVTAKFCNGFDNVNLLSESFQSVQIQSNHGSQQAVFGNIKGTLNAEVAAYFGVSSQFSLSSFSSSIKATGNPGSFLWGTNLGGTVKAGPTTNIPESWGIAESVAFFASAFLAFAALLRFRVLRPVPIA